MCEIFAQQYIKYFDFYFWQQMLDLHLLVFRKIDFSLWYASSLSRYSSHIAVTITFAASSILPFFSPSISFMTLCENLQACSPNRNSSSYSKFLSSFSKDSESGIYHMNSEVFLVNRQLHHLCHNKAKNRILGLILFPLHT